jgi:hypothetical protein
MPTQRPPLQRTPLRPERVRRIDGGFAFVPNRFLHDGFFVSLTHVERSLYLFLVLAGDRNGVSFYGYDRICGALELVLDDYLQARNSLLAKDLIAFDGARFQVLSLPVRPVHTPARPLVAADDLDEHDPATVHAIVRSSFDRR